MRSIKGEAAAAPEAVDGFAKSMDQPRSDPRCMDWGSAVSCCK